MSDERTARARAALAQQQGLHTMARFAIEAGGCPGVSAASAVRAMLAFADAEIAAIAARRVP